ncbi:hypothetical protein, unlikely [Trypanosoma brucei gambiense DAL972]|uniref:Uncharacterized protein n=1 Tax=Trypanosoma brucei gambiense (strain MHOM/CI/86/DAL972) TaxID=679716 RepID=C9ZPX3_TRYB9|nr:hypothetical protein, unlikely [Trypanosoma brucei gambiense DAL972]CBH11451.1 hypothetical protein, unlikely [Trypanosoma brucei gambiense DAL972]|eukprot:XP_011773738.1 hypothetical protein, unlikely [Trypanosoma brucei gambiense DAL972]
MNAMKDKQKKKRQSVETAKKEEKKKASESGANKYIKGRREVQNEFKSERQKTTTTTTSKQQHQLKLNPMQTNAKYLLKKLYGAVGLGRRIRKRKVSLSSVTKSNKPSDVSFGVVTLPSSFSFSCSFSFSFFFLFSPLLKM